jgi:hypothetical protein
MFSTMVTNKVIGQSDVRGIDSDIKGQVIPLRFHASLPLYLRARGQDATTWRGHGGLGRFFRGKSLAR